MLTLRKMTQADAPILAEWWASSRIEDTLVELGRPDLPQVLLVAEEGGRIIGAANAFDIRTEAGACEVGVGVFPHAPPGTGPRILAALIDELFRAGFRRVQAKVRGDNPRALRIIRRSPFVLEGVMREAVPSRDGGYADVYLYSILAEEFQEVRRRYSRLFRSGGGMG